MSAASFKDEGNKHLQAKEFEKAIACYSQAIELDPNDHVFYSNRSAAYLSLKSADKALEDANSCVRIKKDWPKGYTRQGAAYHSMKRYDEAIKAYEEGLKIAPTDAGLKSGLEEVKALKDSASRGGASGFGGMFDDINMMTKLATNPKFAHRLGDPAFQAKLKMLKSNPQFVMQDPEMMEVLQVILGGVGGGDEEERPEPKKAPSSSSSAGGGASKSAPPKPPAEPEEPLSPEEIDSKKRKTSSVAAKERGNNFYKEKKFAEALAAYEEAIALDPTNMMFLNNKAAVYIETGDIDTAIACCNEALEVGKLHRAPYEDKAKVYQRMAAAEVKRGNLGDAIKYYEKSQMEFADKAVQKKMKDLELEYRKQKLKAYLSPELGAEAKERGNAAFREGNFAKAIEEYEEAIKRDPSNASYHNNLAATFCKTNLWNDAKREVEKCLEIDETFVKGWAKKGDIELFFKEYHKALDSYKKGLSIDPENTACKEGLQKTYMKINSSSESEEDRNARAQRAAQDPEINAILNDPSIRRILQDASEDPKAFQQAYNNPNVRSKIDKLIAAGVLKMG